MAKYFKLGGCQFTKTISPNEHIYVRSPRPGYPTADIWTLEQRTKNNWKPCTKEEYDTAFEQAMERINQLNNQK